MNNFIANGHNKPFQIRDYVEFDQNGRANCPCCGKGRRKTDKSLSLVPNTEFGYKCFRGCTPAEIREELGVPAPKQNVFGYSPNLNQPTPVKPTPIKPSLPTKDYSVDEDYVNRASSRLLEANNSNAKKARQWLLNRGISTDSIRRLKLGLGLREIIPDENQPHLKETYGAICLFIPIPHKPGRFYVKKRVAPWLSESQRPPYLGKWSQFGVPATIWFTYLPENPIATWMCEGEWDAIVLAQLLQQRKILNVAVACSTAGCGSVPKQTELARLPGDVVIFYDRNDAPKKDGTRAGDEGAKKLALALDSRGKIAQVPMAKDCQIKGWDVSDAINGGFDFDDFLIASKKATSLSSSEKDSLTQNSKTFNHSSLGQNKEQKTMNTTATESINYQEFGIGYLLKHINDLLEKGLPEIELTACLPILAKITQFAEKNVSKIYSLKEKEIEISEEREDTARMVSAVQYAKSANIMMNNVLPSSVAQPFNQYAQWLNVKPEALFLAYLITMSSLHNPQTTTVVNQDWNFEVKPNLYGAIVAPPSQKKSPIINTISREPLKVLERKARQAYKQQVKEYEELIQKYESLDTEERESQFPEGKPKAPPNRRKVYSFTKTTSEGLREQVKAYPEQGLLAIPDELAGLLKSMNVYRNGRGSDEEDLLSYYDGAGERVLRASGLAGDFDNLLLGILGTIQPEVLKGFFGNCQDDNGRWSRFMFVNQPLTASKMSSDGGSFDLIPMLADIYEKVTQLPAQKYHPTKEAFEYYTQVYNELEQRRIIDPNPAMSAVWGKAEGRIAKIATNLHITYELMAGRTPDIFIPKERYVEATEYTLFSVQQTFSLYKEFGEAGSLPSNLTKVIELSKKKGFVSARDVMQRIDSKSRPKAADVRGWFQELKAMGYGETSGEGRSLKFRYIESGEVDSKSTNSSTDEIIDLSSFQPNVEFVGEAGVFLHPEKINHQKMLIRKQHQRETASSNMVDQLFGGQLKNSEGVISQNRSTISTSPTMAPNQVMTKDVAVDDPVDNNSTLSNVDDSGSTFIVSDANVNLNQDLVEVDLTVDLTKDIWLTTDDLNSLFSQADEMNKFNLSVEGESVNLSSTVNSNGNEETLDQVESNLNLEVEQVNSGEILRGETDKFSSTFLEDEELTTDDNPYFQLITTNSNRTPLSEYNLSPLEEYSLISQLENCDKIETLHSFVKQYPHSIVKSIYNLLNQAKQQSITTLIDEGANYLTNKGVSLSHFKMLFSNDGL